VKRLPPAFVLALRVLAGLIGVAVVVLAVPALAVTSMPLLHAYGAALLGLLALVGAGLRWRGLLVLALPLALAPLYRRYALDVPVYPGRATLAAGQYTAKSDDPLRLVTARIVVRENGSLIFAEAWGAPFAGLARETLWHEPHRALFHQALPPQPDPRSDPTTVTLLYNALSKALAGEVPREEPAIPEGARVEGGSDTYWGMFPDEFDHRCDLSRVKDGKYRGVSTNPLYPVTVDLDVAGGRIAGLNVIQGWSSWRGEAGLRDMPKKIVRENEINVDAVSGATRSSLIVRSAAWKACQNAKGGATR
jgi:uncharacterized protein with FMN-binding domain